MSEASVDKKMITQMVSDEATVLDLVQLRPNTFCRLQYVSHDDETHFIGVGFSKVCHGDTWSRTFGSDMAHKKAVAHIVKQIMGKVERY